MNELILGDKLFVHIGDSPIAYSTTCSLELSSDSIDTSNKEAGNWKSSLPGQNGWTVSTDALITKASGKESIESIITAWKARLTVQISFVQKDTSDTVWYNGEAFITSCSISANNGEVASMSVTFTGNGELKTGTATV